MAFELSLGFLPARLAFTVFDFMAFDGFIGCESHQKPCCKFPDEALPLDDTDDLHVPVFLCPPTYSWRSTLSPLIMGLNARVDPPGRQTVMPESFLQ